ncbi:MAG: glycoside hydrolase family 32 protein, partial [Anaerolineales bacterium]
MMSQFTLEDLLTIRKQMASDPHRPGYHFLSPHNWMNDPNGLFYWQGRYHLFYQYNPNGPMWGDIHWGHASSKDLIHWQDHPLALTPEPGGGDAEGCWSGCVIKSGDQPAAIYTGYTHPDETPIMLAHAQDADLINWQKSPYNPIIKGAPEGVITTLFRDPYVWKDGQRWLMAVGAGMRDGQCAILRYQSNNLVDWTYEGPLFKARINPTVSMWECPNFFRLDDYDVLLVSLFPDIQGVYYYIGNEDGQIFSPQSEGYLEIGTVFYAPHVRQFDDGRTLLFAWLMEGRSTSAIEAAGWAGVQSLPRELSLDEHQRLVSLPAREVRALRKQEVVFEDIALNPTERIKIPIGGKHLEIEVIVQSESGVVGLEVLSSPNGEEKTCIKFDARNGMGELDTRQSSLSKEVQTNIYSRSLADGGDGLCRFRVFVDASVIEVWFNESLSISGRA